MTMSDLVEVAREGLKQCQELDIQYSPAQELIAAMADEIERLQREAMAHRVDVESIKQTVLDDLREFGKQASEERRWGSLWSFNDFLDAYEKDRGIE